MVTWWNVSSAWFAIEMKYKHYLPEWAWIKADYNWMLEVNDHWQRGLAFQGKQKDEKLERWGNAFNVYLRCK